MKKSSSRTLPPSASRSSRSDRARPIKARMSTPPPGAGRPRPQYTRTTSSSSSGNGPFPTRRTSGGGGRPAPAPLSRVPAHLPPSEQASPPGSAAPSISGHLVAGPAAAGASPARSGGWDAIRKRVLPPHRAWAVPNPHDASDHHYPSYPQSGRST